MRTRTLLMTVTAVFASLSVVWSQQATKPVARESHEKTAADPTERLLAAYGHVQSQLASDKAVSAGDFERIAEAARAAASAHPGAKGLEELASAAQTAASKASQGLAKAREGFGEVSRGLITLIGENPELARGRNVFECPMAKAYQKWVQESKSVANPYMGQQMLTCGTASEWRP